MRECKARKGREGKKRRGTLDDALRVRARVAFPRPTHLKPE